MDNFCDIKDRGPKPEEILARFITFAELLEGDYKETIYNLLCDNVDGANLSCKLLKEQIHASGESSISLLLEMAKDIKDGISKEEIFKKPYKFVFERFFYVEEQYVPKDDQRWQVISLINKTENHI